MTLLAALVAMVYVYSKHRKTAGDRRASFIAYAGTALVVGGLAFVLGTATGIYAACSSPSAGNLCGLAGVFGSGPLLAGIAILSYVLLWKARHAP
jgi:hypothetical protein